MSTTLAPAQSRIADRLRGRSLLVTGSTGLLAKVFVEKLLRSVPEIGRIYLLVRSRPDGTSSQQRLQQEVMGSSVFDRLRALLGPRFQTLCSEKLQVIDGDLTRERLGLQDADLQMLTEHVDMIINSAASVTFDERLDAALALNAFGPTRLLELARLCGNAFFMQVSTCYVSGRRTGEIPETLGGPAGGQLLDIDAVIGQVAEACAELKGNTQLNGEALHRKLVAAGMEFAHRHGWNDTYTFTKWLAEQRVDGQRGEVPTVILRPAIIESSYEEPVPGWIDGLRMADPMIMAYGRGKLDAFPADADVPIDVIPVDFVANAMIAALPAGDPQPGLKVYQVCSSRSNPLLVGEMVRYLEEGFRRRPMVDEGGAEVRVEPFKLVSRDDFVRSWQRKLEQAQRLRQFLERWHIMPERRRKLGAAMTQIEQVIYFARIYSPYTHLNGRFLDDRLRALAESLHPDDQALFPFDAAAIDWPDYIANRHIGGLRRFVLGGSVALDAPPPQRSIAEPDDRRIRQARDQGRTIFDVFQSVARLCDDKVALQIRRGNRWVRYTYQEALCATAAVARRFVELNLAPGDRVVICGDNGPEWGITYLAAMRLGLTAVPLDPQLPPAEVFACAEFAGAKLICAGSAYQDLCDCPDNDGPREPIPVLQMAEPFVPPPGASRDPGPDAAELDLDHVASILFTSGTTVNPKAVPLTHANILANARGLLEVHRLKSDERFVSVLPMYHAFEFTAGFVVPMIVGGMVTYVEDLKGPQVLAAMQAAGCTSMLVVPRLLKLFYDAIQRRVRESGLATRAAFRSLGRISDLTGGALGEALFAKVHRQFGGHLRRFISGGSALDPELHAAFARMGIEVCEGYGLTETSPVLTVNPPDGGKAGSVGPAVPGVTLEIRNANQDGVGELWARGESITAGYLNDAEASAQAFRDGWFRTGDLCRRDGDGYFYITGRVKDMVVTEAGKNVYPDEVEVRYKDLPYVKEMCVLGMPGGSGVGEAVHAVVVPDTEAHPEMDPSTLERTIREAASEIGGLLPDYQRIATLHFWNRELPKTSTLKAKRGEIRALLGDQRQGVAEGSRVVSAAAPQARAERDATLTTGQHFVRELLSKLTREPPSMIHQDTNLLLDLGMDSLMKLQLLAELEAHFDLSVSNETASALARVGDLYQLVGDHAMVSTKSESRRTWRDREPALAAAAAPANGPDGEDPWALLPTRAALRGSLSLFLKTYVRVRGRGLEHIPAEGSFILAANHSSHLDAASVLTAVGGRRRVWAAGAEDYFFDKPLKRWVFSRILDTIPFNRHSEGFDGLGRCMEKLRHGHGVLFFPEGTRSTTGDMADFKIGVALMAIESGIPVIPTRIENAFELLPKGRRLVRPGVIRITFGPPVSPQPWMAPDDVDRQYQLYREMVQEIQRRVAELDWPTAQSLEAS